MKHRLRSQDSELMLSAFGFHNNSGLEQLPLISSKRTMEKTVAEFHPWVSRAWRKGR